MNLLLIRHGEAGKRLADDAPGGADDQRCLTARGRRRLRHGMKGLRRLVSTIDSIAYSPLPRASESAEIVADVFGASGEMLPDLAPDVSSQDRLLQWIDAQPEEATIALIGHEPTLSALAAKLTTGGPAYFELKKGGVCLVIRSSSSSTLRWLITAKQLRACR